MVSGTNQEQAQMDLKMLNGVSQFGFQIERLRQMLLMMFYYMSLCMHFHTQQETVLLKQTTTTDKKLEIFLEGKSF